MCRHCERLKEDADFKDTMHKFMERTAKNFQRMLEEQGKSFADSGPITADDITIEVKLDYQRYVSGARVVNRILGGVFEELPGIHNKYPNFDYTGGKR